MEWGWSNKAPLRCHHIEKKVEEKPDPGFVSPQPSLLLP
jgi:hypothetical protein